MKTFKLFGMIVLIKLGLDLITVSNSDSLVLWVQDYAVVNSKVYPVAGVEKGGSYFHCCPCSFPNQKYRMLRGCYLIQFM